MGALRFITLQNKEGRNALLFKVRKRENRIFITGVRGGEGGNEIGVQGNHTGRGQGREGYCRDRDIGREMPNNREG